MLRRIAVRTLAIVLAGSSLASRGASETKQISTVRVHSQIEVSAAPALIWPYLTRGRNFAGWMSMWKSPSNARVAFLKVGDSAEFTDAWNNRGRTVVTYIARLKELRAANDPTDGSFMGQIKFMLEPKGGSTLVHLYDQYTDESPPAENQATAQKVQAELDRALKALKAAVEKRA